MRKKEKGFAKVFWIKGKNRGSAFIRAVSHARKDRPERGYVKEFMQSKKNDSRELLRQDPRGRG